MTELTSEIRRHIRIRMVSVKTPLGTPSRLRFSRSSSLLWRQWGKGCSPYLLIIQSN